MSNIEERNKLIGDLINFDFFGDNDCNVLGFHNNWGLLVLAIKHINQNYPVIIEMSWSLAFIFRAVYLGKNKGDNAISFHADPNEKDDILAAFNAIVELIKHINNND